MESEQNDLENDMLKFGNEWKLRVSLDKRLCNSWIAAFHSVV